MSPNQPTHRFLPHDALSRLISTLITSGYTCIGPSIEDGAIVFQEYEMMDLPPRGIQANQLPGSYRLTADPKQRYFAWANGPQAIKPWLFRAVEPLWRSEHSEDRLSFMELVPDMKRLAIIGVRACDLAALAIQDRHFMQGPCQNTHYARRREGLFLVAVQCAEPAATCFCASTGDGPAPKTGCDISLSELESGFVVTPLTERGQAVIALLNLSPAADALLEEVRVQEHDAMGKQTRSLPAHSLSQVLLNCLEHPRWDDVAMRCLACGNCTAVCPTCFCHRQEAQPELGNHATAAIRKWDSCFGEDHGQIHGFQVRPDTRSRYRQWLVHKLDTWHGQFGRSGCVGCGRCMTWCPVGIDLTEEVAALTEKR